MTRARRPAARPAAGADMAWSPYGSVRAVRSAGRDYVFVLSGQVVFAIVAAASLTIVARLLGPDGYGAVALFSALVQFCFIVGVKWAFPGLVRYGREALIRRRSAGTVFWPWAALVVIATGGWSIAVAVLGDAIARFTGLSGHVGAIFLLLFSQTVLSAATVQVLQMEGRQAFAAWLPVVGRVMLLLMLVSVASVSSAVRTPSGVLVLSGLALAIQFVASVRWLSRDVLRPVAIERRGLVVLLAYSGSLILAYAGFYASDWIDVIVLRAFRSRVDVGQYQLAYQAMLFAATGLVALNTLAFPLLSAWQAEGRETAVTRYVTRLVPQLSLLWLFVVLGLGVAAAPSFGWVFGEGFSRSGSIFSILLAAAAFLAIDSLYGPLLLVHDLTGRATIAVVVTAAINIAGDLALVPRLGVIGAALATLTSFAFAAWLKMRWGNERVRAGSPIVFRATFVVALVLLAMAVVGSWTRLALGTAAAAALVASARRNGTFAMADLDLIGAASIPVPVWQVIRWIYARLSPPLPVACS